MHYICLEFLTPHISYVEIIFCLLLLLPCFSEVRFASYRMLSARDALLWHMQFLLLSYTYKSSIRVFSSPPMLLCSECVISQVSSSSARILSTVLISVFQKRDFC